MKYDEDLIDELMRLVAADIEIGESADVYRDERFLAWLAEDLRAGLSGEERVKDSLDASAFGRRIAARIAARRAEKKLPRRELRQRSASSVASASESLLLAAREGCATLLDLAVAAGVGRELWEEPCEEWLNLPDDIVPSERYVALRVAGDSMSPVLEPRDVILIKLGSQPAIDELVVAHIPEQGYVVKYVSAIRENRIELSSFNHEYGSTLIPRSNHAILGTVLARFRRE
jgi:SOS-response transcriptional repressor LexA